MKLKDRLLLAIVPWLAVRIIRLLHGTMRIDFCGEERLREFWQRGEHMILPFWHDQLLLMVMGYRGPLVKTLISASKDGELLARAMRYFGHDAVRGSSSKGGRAAFKELLALSREPVDLVLTPDGPKGPRHELKDGVIQLARLSGRAVVPMAFVCSRGYRFASWDRFLLPYPFSRGVYSFGEPIYFDQTEGVTGFRQRLKEAMQLNQQRAEVRLEEYGVSSV